MSLTGTVIERKHPAPLYNVPATAQESPLRKFICAQDDATLFLGPRRYPAIACPPNNTETSIAISTSVGFRQLEAHRYIEAIQKLKPDIAIGLADLVLGRAPGLKRRGKMVDRTHAYTRDALEHLYGENVADVKKSKTKFFAPVLPLDNTQQSLYLDDLEDEFRDRISGLALYESASLGYIPETLGDLPRLLLSEPSSPHEVLRQISLGADLLTVPFLQGCSDAGIALDFEFPVSAALSARGKPQPLGLDLWSSEHAKDVSPLVQGCECYACRKHHRAYFNHLLRAKEMAAWALLQMHNHHVIDRLLAGARESIKRGTFEQDADAFYAAYLPDLPDRTGEGPR
jgi:queuine tRNA-ribosyltransferase